MFGNNSSTHMPDAFLTDCAVWDEYIGLVWHSVLAPLALRAQTTVVEIAPGSSTKIGHALARLGFCGDLHIVEASPDAIDALLPKYEELLPQARLHTHVKNLSAACAQLPRQPDIILASHVLDDMLLAQAHTSATFDWAIHYSDCISNETTQAWRVISANTDILDKAIKNTVAEIAQAIDILMPRHLVINQYPSATLRDNNLDALNQAALQVLDDIAQKVNSEFIQHDCKSPLMHIPNYNNPHIGLHVLNPRYWLSCTRKI